MTKNVGKKFEDILKSSVPDYAKIIRIPDPPQSFTKRKDTKYSHKNPYDFEIFDTVGRVLYCLELKSTSQKYLSYQVDENDDKRANIQWHQIEGLTKASEFDNVIAGLFCNFRLDNGEQLLYFFDIKDFNNMKKNSSKRSFNIIDISLNGGIKINGEKKRVNYKWNIDEFLISQSNKYPL